MHGIDSIMFLSYVLYVAISMDPNVGTQKKPPTNN